MSASRSASSSSRAIRGRTSPRSIRSARASQGKVVSITNYGAFIELEPGIEGLVHISEMSWTRNVRHPSKLVSIGETIEAVVLKVDPNEEKISLGMKQTEQDPWMVLPLKYPVGTRINGKVRNLTSFGAFVEIEPGIDGLIHISDMSWTKRVQHPSEVVKKGDAVDVVILNIDSENKRISLGLKQAEEDPWLRIGETYPVGTELRSHGRSPDGQGRRRRHRQRHRRLRSDLAARVTGEAVNSPADVVYEAMNLDMRVLEVDPIHRRIVLERRRTFRRSSRPVRRRRRRSTPTTATRSTFRPTSPPRSNSLERSANGKSARSGQPERALSRCAGAQTENAVTRVLRRCALSASWLAVAATSCEAAAVSSAAARAISLDAACASAWVVVAAHLLVERFHRVAIRLCRLAHGARELVHPRDRLMDGVQRLRDGS